MTKIRKYTQSINNENDTRCPFAANINVSNQPDASQHNLNFTHILTRKPRARARALHQLAPWPRPQAHPPKRLARSNSRINTFHHLMSPEISMDREKTLINYRRIDCGRSPSPAGPVAAFPQTDLRTHTHCLCVRAR